MRPSISEPTEPESTIHPPLACDGLGNLLPIPEGTAAWRICRHTAGRPRALTGPDGAALRFPLSTTAIELVDLCGPDTYRVYALDELGEVLDFITTIPAARPRNANLPDVPSVSALRVSPLAAPTTDLRFALHAVAEIARINGEALRSISDSQADWIKTLAMNKGLPRNVAFPMVPPPREGRDEDPDDRDRDELDNDYEAEPAANPMMQFLSTVTPLIPGLVADWRGKKADGHAPETSSTAPGMAHLARIQQQLTPRERAFLAALLTDEQRGEGVTAELAALSVEEVVGLVREHCARPRVPRSHDAEPISKQLRERALTLLPLLSAGAQARLMALAPKFSATSVAQPELRRMVAELASLDDAAAVAWIEANLHQIEKAVAS